MRKLTLTLLLTFLSLCTYAQLALEGFEAPWTGSPAAPPGGWVVYKQIGNITWAQSPTGNAQIPPYQGTNAAYLNKENVTPGSPIPTNWLITPQFNSPTNGLLHFYSRMIYPGDYGSIFKIKIAIVTDPTVPAANLPWVDLVPPMGEFEMNPIQQQYVEKTMSIPAAYDGQQIRIAFIMQGDDQERWLIDDVEVISVCNPPSTLTATNNGLTSIDLNWTNPGGITTWEIEIIEQQSAPTGTGEIYTGSLPYHKTGLITDTDYKFYVRSVCSDGGESEWVGPVNFSTTKIGEKCNAPIVIPNTSLPYTTVNNTASYNDFYDGVPGTGCGTTTAYLNGNDVVYSYTPNFTGNIHITLANTLANAGVFVYSDCNNIGISCINGALSTATASAVIPSLAVTAGTTYYFVVSSQFTTIPYTLTIQQVNCNAPSGLAVSGITPVTANLSWTANGATAWQIMVQPADSGFPTVAGQNVTQNTNLAVTSTTSGTPFSPATSYEYYVRSSCASPAGSYSIWTGPFAFSTTQVLGTLPFTETFENPHGWSILNGTQPNKWFVGTATANASSKSLYVSNDNGLNNLYTINTASIVHAYRDIQIPVGATLLGLGFDLKSIGETNDYVRAWIVPTTFVPTPGTAISAASDRIQIGPNYNLTTGWITKTDIANVTAFAGSTRRIIFEWRNNSSAGVQPPAAIDNINLALVTCAPPTALTVTSSTPTSATFNWTAASAGSPGSYEYYYSQSPVPPTLTTTEMGSVTGTTVTISQLTENETYYVWVRSNCGGNKSFWTPATSVLIPQTPGTIPYTQNFDGAPAIFTLVNGTQLSTWAIGQATSNSPLKSMYITTDNGLTNSYDSTNSAVVQAYKDIIIPVTATDINISFNYKSMGDANDYMRVWMVPATFFPTAGTQITAAADRVQLGGNYQGYENWTNIQQETPVTAYQGQKRRLVFEWRNNGLGLYSPPAAVDNINVSLVVCARPTTLAVTNVTFTNATLDWVQPGSATNWEVVHMPAIGAVPPTATTTGTPVSGNSEYTPPAGTFVPGIQYVFYVRTNCGGSAGISNWSGPFLFALKPLNDECAQSTIIPLNTTSTCTTFASGNITGATGSVQVSTCGGTKDDDIWFEFTATSTKHLITLKNLAGSDTNVWHTLYSGTDCTALTEMYCSNITVSLAQGLVVGQTYKVRVYTNTATPNQTTTFDICVTTPPAQPANDECTGATALAVNPTLVPTVMTDGTVQSATPSGLANTCTGTPDDDVWYSFVATNATHKISLIQIKDNVGMTISVYSGACGALTWVKCNGNNQTAVWVNNLVAGQTYWVRLFTVTNLAGLDTTYKIAVTTPVAAPANDDCVAAIVTPVNPTGECAAFAHGNIISATASTAPATTCGTASSADDDIWFEFTATSTTHVIEFKNFVGQGFGIVSDFDNLNHALYTGACNALTLVYCNTNNTSIASGLTIGQVYKLRVWSNTTTPNQQCEFDVCITTPTVASNDECSTAITIPVNPDSYCNVYASGTVFAATPSPVANTCTGTADDDVWFEFTATSATHLIYIDKITGTTNQLYYSLYSGDCGGLNLLNCNASIAGTYSNFIIGNTYKIRVYTNQTGNQSTAFNICVRVPNTPINVNDSLYTHEELVTQVLFNTPCATVSNVTSKSGLPYGIPSIGYFDAANSFFPFKYGVILTNNNVNEAEGPYTFNSDSNALLTWPGDDDLDNIILENNPSNNNPTYNASALEFDFVPMINNFEFEFLFASAEYGSFQCSFGDAFAFILTDEDGNQQNLAVIPNTTTPVSVVNIRSAEFNNNCQSENINYFGQYNATQGLASAINFNGQTVPMIASAIVVPGQTYHIKLVIEDYSDPLFASAIFLGGGTFNIGTLDLGANLTVAEGTALCDTESVVLDTHLTPGPYTFTWFKDGVVIPDADQPTYEVTEAGTYGVEAAYIGVDCSFEGSRIIEFFPLVNDATGDPVNMTACDASGFHTFDLTPNVDALLSLPTDPANYTVSIHFTEQDAIDGINAIDPATYTVFTNTVEDLQTLWTRTSYSGSGCFGIKSFDLIVQDLTPQYTIDSDFSICDGTSDTIDVVITDTDPNPVTYTWTKDGAPLPDTTPSITVTETGAYTVVLDRTGCTATSTVNVVVTPIPVADAPADVTVCESYELPALSANNTYYDAVTNAVVAPGTVITVTTTFNIVASSGTTPECTSQNTFTVTVNNAPILSAIADVAACDSYILPALTVGNYYTETGGPAGTGTILNAGDEITASQTVYVYADTATTPNCISEISFEVTVTASPVADAPAAVEACDGYLLPALTPGNAYWTAPNGTGSQIAEGTNITSTQLIYVFAQSAANPNCTDENSFTVTVTPTPAFSLGETRVACLASNVTITIADANWTEVDGPLYLWTTPNGSVIEGVESITASLFGTYTLTVTVNNCFHSESVKVEENETPVALVITEGCENGVYMVGVSDEDGSFNPDTAAYSWTGPNGFTSDKQQFAATAIGEYFVTVTTAEGCIIEDSIIVSGTSCTIQKGISPNNDGSNDYFDLTELMVKHLSIFNRYGQEVYSKDNYTNEWNGQTNKGDELPTGTYFYMIEITGGESKTGWIYINRQD